MNLGTAGVLALCLHLWTAWGMVYNEDTILSKRSTRLDSLTVNVGVFFQARDMAHLHVSQGLVNHGLYYQWCSSGFQMNKGDVGGGQYPLTVLSAEKGFHNLGVFIYDYRDALMSPNLLVAGLGKIVNTGYMWIACGGSLGKTSYNYEMSKATLQSFEVNVLLGSERAIKNTGSIMILGHGTHITRFELALYNYTAKAETVTNTGVICIKSTAWAITTDISGDGCISVSDSSHLYLNDHYEISNDQLIYFDTTFQNAAIFIDMGPSRTRKVHYHVAGFRRNAFIVFSKLIRNWVYKDGVLKVRPHSEYTHYIHLGFGYKLSKFRLVRLRLMYQGAAPILTPAKCRCNYRIEDGVAF